jgi:hypothetical protein
MDSATLETMRDLPVRQINHLRGPARQRVGEEQTASLANSDILQPGSRNHCPASLLASRHNPFWRDIMKNLAIYLAAGAGTLILTAASAAPLSPNASVAPESNIQNVRMVCNEDGRCWRERGERRVIVRESRDSYGYAPRERYIERRGYEERGGIGIRAPGVSVGIGAY